MVDAMNHGNLKQPNTHDFKRKIQIATIEAKYANTN